MIHRDRDIKQPELDIYPLTIVSDRYGGVYSMGKFTAWNLITEDVPGSISSNDTECGQFWGEYTGIVGIGYTPDEALEDLHRQMRKNETK